MKESAKGRFFENINWKLGKNPINAMSPHKQLNDNDCNNQQMSVLS